MILGSLPLARARGPGVALGGGAAHFLGDLHPGIVVGLQAPTSVVGLEAVRGRGKVVALPHAEIVHDKVLGKGGVGEIYTITRYEMHTGLRDVKEFATVLNSCGRYDDAETGLRICLGDMTALEDAERNRADHRKHISSALSYIKEGGLLRERRFIQYFDAGPEIRETVVGIVAGILLNSGDANRMLPILAFAEADDGIKVSARANRALTDRGLDLSFIMKTASEIVGGYGGGHKVAAGATIPTGKEEDFLDIVEDLVSSQII